MDVGDLLANATEYYLKSKDYNGYPCHHVRKTEDITADQLRVLLRPMVKEGLISLVFGDRHSNPHIRAYDDEPIDCQLNKLEQDELFHTCIYPSGTHLAQVVDRNDYNGRPFSLALALSLPPSDGRGGSINQTAWCSRR